MDVDALEKSKENVMIVQELKEKERKLQEKIDILES